MGRSQEKRREAREKHHLAKNRAKYNKVINLHKKLKMKTEDGSPMTVEKHAILYATAFDNLIQDLTKMNIKVIHVMLNDLNARGAIPPYYGQYHWKIVDALTSVVMERTMLK